MLQAENLTNLYDYYNYEHQQYFVNLKTIIFRSPNKIFRQKKNTYVLMKPAVHIPMFLFNYIGINFKIILL